MFAKWSKKLLAMTLCAMMLVLTVGETQAFAKTEGTFVDKLGNDDVSGNDEDAFEELPFEDEDLVGAGNVVGQITIKDSKGGVVVSLDYTDDTKAKTGFTRTLQKAFDICGGYLQNGKVFYTDYEDYKSIPAATAENPYTITMKAGKYEIYKRIWMYSNTTLDMTGVTFYRNANETSHRILLIGTERSVSSVDLPEEPDNEKEVDEENEEIEDAPVLEPSASVIAFKEYEVKNVSIIGSKDKPGCFDGSGLGSGMVVVAHAQNVNFSYITFTNVTNAHCLELAAVADSSVTNCKFTKFTLAKESTVNFEALQLDVLQSGHFADGGVYDGTICKNITISNNTFEGLNRGVGTHSAQYGRYFDGITITNNTFKNIKGYAVIATNYVNANISNNTITDCGSGILFAGLREVNFYEGDAAGVGAIHNTKICDNTITVTNKGYDVTLYGIKMNGQNVTAEKKIKVSKKKSFILPQADYRPSGMTVSGNKITMKTAGVALWCSGVKDSTLSGNTITMDSSAAVSNSQADGIRLEDDTDGVVVTGNTITNSGKTMLRHGIYVRGTSEGNSVLKNTVTNASENGIYLTNTGDGSPTQVVVEENSVTKSGKIGIYANNQIWVDSISKNTIVDTAGHAIYVNSKANVTKVEENTIKKDSASVSSERGICVADNSVVGSIKNNNISNVKEHGIMVNSVSTIDAIEGNTITNSPSNGLYINGQSKVTTIKDNSITTSKNNGLYINGSSQVQTLTANTVVDSVVYAIGIKDSVVDKVTSNTVKKSKKSVSSKRGLFIQGGGSVVGEVSKNNISDTKEYAINVSNNGTANNIKSNTVKNCGAIGIYATANARVKNISSNNVSKASKYGISLNTSKKKTTITANKVSNAKIAGIFLMKGSEPACTNNTVKVAKNGYTYQVGGLKGVSTTIKIKSIKCKSKAVTITWNEVPEADEYAIYRATKKTGKYTLAGTVDANSKEKEATYTDKKAPKKTCYYKIAARSKNGVTVYEATASAVKSVKVK